MNYRPRKQMKVAVLRENLYKLTGEDAISAMILNQLIYWSDIMDKADQQTLEAIEAFEASGDHETAKKLESQLKNGWFWKSANQLSKEIMIASRPTVTKRLNDLEKKGFITSRAGESYDKPKNYKVNLSFVKQELRKLGYTLDGYIEEGKNSEKKELSESQENKPSGGVPTEQGEHMNPVPTEQGVFPQNRGGVPTEQGGCSHRTGGVFPQNNLEDYNTEITKENTKEITKQQQQDVVVVKQNISLFELVFGLSIKEKQMQSLMNEAKKHNKDIKECIRNTRLFFEFKGEKPENPVGAVLYDIREGWSLDALVSNYRHQQSSNESEEYRRRSEFFWGVSNEEKVPQVFQQEMEKEENPSPKVPEVDPEARARIMDQLNRMRQRMNQRMNEGGGNLQ